MRVIFAGTPEFARVALQQLQDAGFEIPLVLTQPDRPAGRGMKLQASAVKQWALDLPRLGCLNIHASLLPRWRGAAPIHRAIQAGDAQTGVAIMQMDAGLDTGDMLLVEKLPIAHTGPAPDTTATLHDKLAALGGRLIVQALELAELGQLTPVKQPADGVSYAHKIEKAEAAVDWTQPVAAIERHIRAMTPFPGATAQLGADTVKLWQARIDSALQPSPQPQPHQAPCGQILSADASGVRVACADGVLTLTELQRAGGKRLPAADFLRGFALQPGQMFEVPRP